MVPQPSDVGYDFKSVVLERKLSICQKMTLATAVKEQ